MPATRNRTNPRRRPKVLVVKQGADMSCDWTPQPPIEQSRFPKYVEVSGGNYDPQPEVYASSITVGIAEADPYGMSVHFTIYAQEVDAGEHRQAALESCVYAEVVREIHAALGAAIEQAEQLGILPPAKRPAPELRVGQFEYTGDRGSAGRWLGKKIAPPSLSS